MAISSATSQSLPSHSDAGEGRDALLAGSLVLRGGAFNRSWGDGVAEEAEAGASGAEARIRSEPVPRGAQHLGSRHLHWLWRANGDFRSGMSTPREIEIGAGEEEARRVCAKDDVSEGIEAGGFGLGG